MNYKLLKITAASILAIAFVVTCALYVVLSRRKCPKKHLYGAFSGVSGCMLIKVTSSGANTFAIPGQVTLSTSGSATQWYYNDTEGSLYNTSSNGPTGFVFPQGNIQPRGRNYSLSIWDASQFWNGQASLNQRVLGWKISGINPSAQNGMSTGVTISYTNPAAQGGTWYLQTTLIQGMVMIGLTPDNGWTVQALNQSQCVSNCQSQNTQQCQADTPKKQQDCLNECADEPSLGCAFGCAIDTQIWNALCSDDSASSPVNCSQSCGCSAPQALIPTCSANNPNGPCPSQTSCINGMCMGLTTIDGGWNCQKCEVANGVGAVLLTGGSGQYIAGEFILNFSYSYSGGMQYSFNLPDLGSQTATLDASGQTLTLSGGDVWSRRKM